MSSRLPVYRMVTIHGRKATTFSVACSPTISAITPTGVTKRFAIPHETPLESELTILRESGQRLWAIAVVTGVLACKKANPTINEIRQRRLES